MVAADGVELATWDLGGEGPPLLLVHATGFHAGTWLPLAPVLRAHHHVWALDQRGHGASGRPPDGSYLDWDRFTADLLAVRDAILGPAVPHDGVYGAGHSMGGAVLLRAAQLRPDAFQGLYCYEPVVVPTPGPARGGDPDPAGDRDDAGDPDPAGGGHLSELARKRRPSFASRSEALANYAGKPPFNRFDPAVLAAYVAHGLTDEPDGTVRLACLPGDEASMFEGAVRTRIWEHLADVRVPVTVAHGGEQDGVSAFAPLVAARLRLGRLQVFEDLDHFGPMTAPHHVATAVAAAFGSSG